MQILRNHGRCYRGDSTRRPDNLHSVVFGDPFKCPILNNKTRNLLATFVLLWHRRGLPGLDNFRSNSRLT
jgi:hypothetical protein